MPATGSLLEGVSEAAATVVGVRDLRHVGIMPDERRFGDIATAVFAGVERNWNTADAAANLDRSRANWRWWEPQTTISARNTSPEVVFERRVALAAARTRTPRWANQVPIASGLTAVGERRRAIDLVERRGAHHFAFVELKVGSDTPLFAAVEVLGYAAIWLLTRRHTRRMFSPIVAATQIDLCVLAPRAFYRPSYLPALEEALDLAVERIGEAEGVRLSFRFDVLEEDLLTNRQDDAELLDRLSARPWLFEREWISVPAMQHRRFLPGVPEEHVSAALAGAPGDELGSGKFDHPQSSAALAVNGFGWFIERPEDLPPFPCLEDLDWPARSVSIEQEMQFPWAGGRHPWLDAVIDTDQHVIGVESKRFEPFRAIKAAVCSEAFDRNVWRDGLERYAQVRDWLRHTPGAYRHLDAAQLVKHALGLATRLRRTGRSLLYSTCTRSLRRSPPPR